MVQAAERPAGVTAIAILVAVNGLSSLFQAWQLLTIGSLVAAVFTALIGLFLLHRSYGIFQVRRSAYLVTIILLSLRALIALITLLTTRFTLEAGIGFILAFLAIAYLTQPGVRTLFQRSHAGNQ